MFPVRRRRVALGTAAAVTGSLALGILVAGPVSLPPAVVEIDRSTGGLPLPSGPEPQVADGPMLAASGLPMAPRPPRAVPPVPVGFGGGRTVVGDGWEIAVSRPYLCPVLMALPEMAVGDSRLVRMTLTIVNDTDVAQNARAWSLDATADGRPVEMVLRPDVGFAGVPDRVLAPGERVRFLVAVRLPAERSAVEVDATRGAAVRATLTGRV